jgi:hypothetical protein
MARRQRRDKWLEAERADELFMRACEVTSRLHDTALDPNRPWPERDRAATQANFLMDWTPNPRGYVPPRRHR